ncbi:MAG: hypothetical protein AAB434_07215 [Planctomycetota bacterium]
MDRFAAGAMEIGADPVPPVPPDLDLDLDLEIDFDSLPEIDLPGEAPPPPPTPKPKAAAPAVRDEEEAPRRRFAWWPLMGGTLALLVVALSAVPFAILRLNDMSRDMTLLAERVEQADAENERLTETLAQEAVDAVSTHLSDTERRIERVRSALEEVRRGQSPPAVAAAPKEEPKPAPAVAKAPTPPPAVQPKQELPRPLPTAPLLPPPPDLEEPKSRPLVGVSKQEKAEPIAPASAVRSAPAPPVPVEKAGPKVALPTPVAKEQPKPAPSGRILLPTELYDENDGEDE